MAGLTPQDIAALEAEIGCVLPGEARAKYSEGDGYLGPTNCNLLYPFRSDGDAQFVRVNLLMKSQEWFPSFLSGVAILGDDGCGNYLCFDPTQSRAILWNPADGDWIQATFASMNDLWGHVMKLYESVA